jgi:glycerol-3-phosphate dehydrogenase (NAD(P)+)
MAFLNTSEQMVGVIGAGSFGTVTANYLAENVPVLLYVRRPEVYDAVLKSRESSGQKLHEKVRITNDLAEVAGNCQVIFPVVPSSSFKDMMHRLGPHLHPYHILIHGTKGLDVALDEGQNLSDEGFKLRPGQIRTMSELITSESVVVRVGCMAGPNLAREMADRQPAATVIASRFDEVILNGQRLLRNDRFQVYGNQDIKGVELCGVLKNIIAIASGALSGLGYGENAKALLISRGLVEMIHVGKSLGGNVKAFLGLAGVGDLIATCNSTLSRNYTVGYRLAKGEKLQEIIATMEEVAEGVNTVRIIKKHCESSRMRAPITENLYRVLFEDLSVEQALEYLMKYPLSVDIDFL